MERLRGIVLRKRPLTETSLIVEWLTDRLGLVVTVAKGALRPKSAFAGCIDLFFVCEIAVVEARRGDLHTLAEVALLDPMDHLRRSYPVTRTACYFAALVSSAVEPMQPVPEIQDLLIRALAFLQEAEPTVPVIFHFESRLAESLGLQNRGDKIAAHHALTGLIGSLPKDRQPLLRSLKKK